MALLRLGAVIGALWALDLSFLALLPVARVVLDPLFAGLLFLTFRLRDIRFLWLVGLGLGLLKDLGSADLFGAWTVSFALSGWMLGACRHLAEREDPLIVGVWAAGLTLISRIIHGMWLLLADPSLRWGQGPWLSMPAAMVFQGWACAFLFPLLQRFLRSPSAGR